MTRWVQFAFCNWVEHHFLGYLPFSDYLLIHLNISIFDFLKLTKSYNMYINNITVEW